MSPSQYFWFLRFKFQVESGGYIGGFIAMYLFDFLLRIFEVVNTNSKQYTYVKFNFNSNDCNSLNTKVPTLSVRGGKEKDMFIVLNLEIV